MKTCKTCTCQRKAVGMLVADIILCQYCRILEAVLCMARRHCRWGFIRPQQLTEHAAEECAAHVMAVYV
jgi:hypothetical protein